MRRRMIEDMTVRSFGEKTQNDYIRHFKNFTIFLGRSPDTATPEDVRAYQLSRKRSSVPTFRPSRRRVTLSRHAFGS